MPKLSSSVVEHRKKKCKYLESTCGWDVYPKTYMWRTQKSKVAGGSIRRENLEMSFEMVWTRKEE